MMTRRALTALLAFSALAAPAAAAEPTVAELQRQIDELKAMVEQLRAAQQGAAPAPVAAATAAPTRTPDAAPAQAIAAAPTAAPPALAVQQPAAVPSPNGKAWYERLRLRGYTQMRLNEIVSGDSTAPAGVSRLRSVHDSGITDQNNFSLRRVRLVIEGDLGDNVSLYLQPDFATGIGNQSVNTSREGFGQLRDAYVDLHWGKEDEFRLRFGQSKVPFGWENLQSSSNRLTIDRSDAINSATPGERDLGIVAYYTPARVKRIWKRLGDDGQKLFGNYGAFGVALYNGQGISRTESNNSLMTVAMATWPVELDGLGPAFAGQVVEFGGSAMLNKYNPELRSGGVSTVAIDDNRVVVHAMLYPQPFGIQAEWTWGRGPEFDQPTNRIMAKSLSGGYVQSMVRIDESPIGAFMPFARWQYYRGGWKSGLNAPRLETDELELGVEFQPIKPLELTLSYAHMKRREADERRSGRAEGDVVRAQVQWNY